MLESGRGTRKKTPNLPLRIPLYPAAVKLILTELEEDDMVKTTTRRVSVDMRPEYTSGLEAVLSVCREM